MIVDRIGGVLLEHGSWLADEVRVKALERAIRQTIRPGDVAVDLGAGTGLLSLMAVRAGARRVYAIEDSEAIELARDVVRDNGAVDQIVLLRGRSEAIELPEKADVLIGYLGLCDGMLSSFADARQRLLKPDARLIPRRFQLVGALATADGEHARRIDTWSVNHCGFDFSPIESCARQQPYPEDRRLESVRSTYGTLLDFDLASIRSRFTKTSARLTVQSDGVVHGVAAWMRVEYFPDDWLSHVPPETVPSWGNYLFSFGEALTMKKGDFADVTLSTHDGQIWRWQVAVCTAGGGERRIDFSTFSGFPFAATRARSLYAVQGLTALGRAAASAMGRLEEALGPPEGVASALTQQFPDAVPAIEAGRALVSEVDPARRREHG
jgi:protein arginine N-methyltransferase 1